MNEKIPSKKDRVVKGMKCPICTGRLVYRENDGQGVSFCYFCMISWMLILLKRYKRSE